MADPTTVNRGYAIPTHGTNVGTWDTPLNGDFNLIDQNLGAVANIALSNATIPLTPAQYACGTIRLTGAVTASVTVQFPAIQGWWVIDNQTTGGFLQQIAIIGGVQSICLEQGATVDILLDGTNVKFRNLQTVGSYLDICDASTPGWILGCSVPPFLNCDGSTFSASTYPYLNGKLGGNTLPDLRGVARYTLNQGTGRLTSGGSGLDGNTRFSLKTTQSATLITSNLPPYAPAGSVAGSITISNLQSFINVGSGANGGTSVFGPTANQGIVTSNPAFSLSLSGSAQGGTSAPFGVVGTGTVSGITLIRAA